MMQPIRYSYRKQVAQHKELRSRGFAERNLIVERVQARKNYTKPERRLLPVKRKVITKRPCPVCGDPESLTVERRRLNTAYVDDEANFSECCIHCYQEAFDYYEELWADYYASRL